MWNRVHLVLWSLAILRTVSGLGCLKPVCQGNPTNDLRPCPDRDGTCGSYDGKREGGRMVKAVDIRCEKNSAIYAPFEGNLYYWRPFGGERGKECADKGVRIEGTNQWQGYVVLIAYVDLDRYGGKVNAGDRIGTKVDQRCLSDATGNFEPHIQLQLQKSGRNIDPTYRLQGCMCTGQICESNHNNHLVGPPYKSSHSFNGVRGWELSCPDQEDTADDESNVVVGEPPSMELRPPIVYAPIEAEMIGRIRLSLDPSGSDYSGCENDGIVLVGSGKWTGFTVRMYNVKFSNPPGLGRIHIPQGTAIGTRLDCPEKGIKTVFLEFRRNGKLLNVTNMIVAENCKLPTHP